MTLVKLNSSKLIIIVFLSFKRAHIWIDIRVCVCPSAQPRRGAGGTEASQVGAPEAGLSGFEAGRCVLPRRSAVNDRSVTCSEALSDGHAKESVLCYLSVSNTINIITYTDV